MNTHQWNRSECNINVKFNDPSRGERREGGMKKEMDKEQDKEEIKKEIDGSTIFTGQFQNCVINLYRYHIAGFVCCC